MKILEHPDKRLRVKAAPIEAFDDALAASAKAMVEAMYVAKGIGLAGPQVGLAQRLFVVDVGREEPAPEVFVNPEIAWLSDEQEAREEGCLSIPGQFAEVKRPIAVRMTYRGVDGAEKSIEADGLLGRCLQHEFDHLDGVLFIDHISSLKRSMLLRKLAKARRNAE